MIVKWDINLMLPNGVMGFENCTEYTVREPGIVSFTDKNGRQVRSSAPFVATEYAAEEEKMIVTAN